MKQYDQGKLYTNSINRMTFDRFLIIWIMSIHLLISLTDQEKLNFQFKKNKVFIQHCRASRENACSRAVARNQKWGVQNYWAIGLGPGQSPCRGARGAINKFPKKSKIKILFNKNELFYKGNSFVLFFKRGVHMHLWHPRWLRP